MTSAMLDASALLAYLLREPESEAVEEALSALTAWWAAGVSQCSACGMVGNVSVSVIG